MILHALANQRVLTITGAAVDSSVIISGLTFAGGHAVGSGCPAGCGGAILINANAQPRLLNLTISNSLAAAGGGLYTDPGSPLVMSGVAVLSNTSTGSGISSGGGVYANGTAALTDGLFENNQCNQTNCEGGGLFALGSLILTDTRFLSNISTYAGGGAFGTGFVTLNGGLFQNNQSGGGGGLAASNNLILTGTQFLSNTATASNGGGGGALAFGSLTLTGGLFQNNRCIATCPGGGLYAGGGLGITNTLFLGNSGQQGAGLYHAAGDGLLVNDLFAANQSAGQGDALFLGSSGAVRLLHTTIASPTLGSGSAIYVSAGTVVLTNSLIASDAVGIENAGGSVSEDYTLFSGVTTHISGTVSGCGNCFTGAAGFVNPAAGDYHLGLGSAAIDTGVNAGITFDIDGDPRPQGAGFDIGYDEFDFATVGVAKSASAGLLAPGQLLTYTLVYSNAGPTLAAGVRLTDIVPANLTNLSVASSGAAITATGGLTYAWQVADLAPGAGGIITVTGVLATHARGTVFTNTATITTTTPETSTSSTSAVSVTVANAPPVAVDDVYTLIGNTTLMIAAPGVLANDTDANNDPLTAVLAAGPLTGTFNLNPDGSFSYTPPHGFAGVVTFTYSANDGLAYSNVATVTITVVWHKLYLPVVLRQ